MRKVRDKKVGKSKYALLEMRLERVEKVVEMLALDSMLGHAILEILLDKRIINEEEIDQKMEEMTEELMEEE